MNLLLWYKHILKSFLNTVFLLIYNCPKYAINPDFVNLRLLFLSSILKMLKLRLYLWKIKTELSPWWYYIYLSWFMGKIDDIFYKNVKLLLHKINT